ncbi:MAG: sigma-54-dependent Fis family transcriptional regulator [Deltaproteobacteria bacterium]|nr:sigma-54-dependent Fis family transcriptional regulator [Deltaproteobacteria bacterium]
MANILIIDDDKMMCGILSKLVTGMGHRCVSTHTLEEGLKEKTSGAYDVVFLDVRLPDGNGLSALPGIREGEFPPEVIIITGAGDADGAELAIRSGAWDYIEKPSSLQRITLPLVRALQYREERRLRVRRRAVSNLNLNGIVGSSSRMKASFEILAQLVSADIDVLITGETGTGKGVFALAIHNNSSRGGKPFVTLDCSVLPETLVESILFGYEKGAFTGADRPRDGLFKQADGGTLFLDEVGDLPLAVQKAFLRVLEERRFRPLGGQREIYSDFRIIAATNKNIEEMVKNEAFREDLYFRLRAFTLELPPLRERENDVTELAEHYIQKICNRRGMDPKGYSPEFMDALRSYHWPGNVRELFRVLESAVTMCQDSRTLFPKHLPDDFRVYLSRTAFTPADDMDSRPEQGVRQATASELPSLREFRKAKDRSYLQQLVAASEGSVTKACGISGLSRAHLYELLKAHGLSMRS